MPLDKIIHDDVNRRFPLPSIDHILSNDENLLLPHRAVIQHDPRPPILWCLSHHYQPDKPMLCTATTDGARGHTARDTGAGNMS
jgi:hypothetical protein